eukprot:11779123-Ditylum_brightwellii.AAC.1
MTWPPYCLSLEAADVWSPYMLCCHDVGACDRTIWQQVIVNKVQPQHSICLVHHKSFTAGAIKSHFEEFCNLGERQDICDSFCIIPYHAKTGVGEDIHSGLTVQQHPVW